MIKISYTLFLSFCHTGTESRKTYVNCSQVFAVTEVVLKADLKPVKCVHVPIVFSFIFYVLIKCIFMKSKYS